jgi:hypothetical protein
MHPFVKLRFPSAAKSRHSVQDYGAAEKPHPFKTDPTCAAQFHNVYFQRPRIHVLRISGVHQKNSVWYFFSSLDRLPQRVDAFGTALNRGLAGAGIAAGDGFFAAFAQTALEGIPATPDSNRAVADYH